MNGVSELKEKTREFGRKAEALKERKKSKGKERKGKGGEGKIGRE